MTTVSAEEGREAMFRVLGQVTDLTTVRMAKLSCEALKPPVDGTLSLLTTLEVTGDQTDEGLATLSKYTVAAIDDDGPEPNDSNTVWRVETAVVAHWALSEDTVLDKTDIQCFAIGHGSLTCHPYAREIVQSATARMSYTPATLDLLHSPWASLSSVDI